MRLRLPIQLVPVRIQYMTLHRAVTQATWDRLRRKVYRAADHRCKACGKGGRLNCHEVWKYDDKRGVARLTGFRALCPTCHEVCHTGSVDWFYSASPRPLDFEAAEYWCKVNGRGLAAWARHYRAAYRKREKRNRRRWRVDLGRWADLVPAKRRHGRWLLPWTEWPETLLRRRRTRRKRK